MLTAPVLKVPLWFFFFYLIAMVSCSLVCVSWSRVLLRQHMVRGGTTAAEEQHGAGDPLSCTSLHKPLHAETFPRSCWAAEEWCFFFFFLLGGWLSDHISNRNCSYSKTFWWRAVIFFACLGWKFSTKSKLTENSFRFWIFVCKTWRENVQLSSILVVMEKYCQISGSKCIPLSTWTALAQTLACGGVRWHANGKPSSASCLWGWAVPDPLGRQDLPWVPPRASWRDGILWAAHRYSLEISVLVSYVRITDPVCVVI